MSLFWTLLALGSDRFTMSGKPEPRAWRTAVRGGSALARVYQLSSFFASAFGAYCFVHAEYMRGCDAGFWWAPVGLWCVLQGPLTYMADVVNFAEEGRFSANLSRGGSIWKDLDLCSACAMVVCGIGTTIGRALMGLARYSPWPIFGYAVASAFALYCKSRSGDCSKDYYRRRAARGGRPLPPPPPARPPCETPPPRREASTTS